MATLPILFPYFGGKGAVAELVWSRLGVVQNYVEPFCASARILFTRPEPHDGPETLNDLNGWITNVWRAIAADPDAVAHYADWPVSELCSYARGKWLFYRPDVTEWIERLRSDPEYYDAKSAGWWLWGQCCWIGSGWGRDERRTTVGAQRPHLGASGMGIHAQRLRDQLPAVLQAYQARLRHVRVCCGDWARVCGPVPTLYQPGITGVFLDPPYGVQDRADCYGAQDSRTVAADVRDWCLEQGDNPCLRIALCGYEGEHVLPGWEEVAWKTNGGYGNQGGDNTNRHRERIWFSPHCVQPLTLFPAYNTT